MLPCFIARFLRIHRFSVAVFVGVLACLFIMSLGAISTAAEVSNSLCQHCGIGGSFSAHTVWSHAQPQKEGAADWLFVFANGEETTNSVPNKFGSEPMVRLRWVQETSGFFPVSHLQLDIHSGAPEGALADENASHYRTQQLLTIPVVDTTPYTVLLSVDESAGILHVAVYKEDGRSGKKLTAYDETGRELYVIHGNPVAVYETNVPFSGPYELISAHDASTTHVYSRFRPVASRIDVGESINGETVLPTTKIDGMTPLSVEFASQFIDEGHFVLRIAVPAGETSARPDYFQRVVQHVSSDERKTVYIPESELPLGTFPLHIDYVVQEHTLLSHTYDMTVGRAHIAIDLMQIDRSTGDTYWVAQTRKERPLPGVDVRIYALMEHIGEFDQVHERKSTSARDEQLVYSGSLDTLDSADGYPFTLQFPKNSGVWHVDFHVEVQPDIQFIVGEATEMFSMDDTDEGFLVALTDQAAGEIVVMDADIHNWEDPAAVRWRWKPHARNGFAGFTHGWGNPSGVKLRYSEVWGGLWMVVVDSKGLAAIVPYPAGDERQWAQVISGNLHSAELLPDGNIAIAASTGGFVRVYTSSQGPDASHYTEYELVGAHGVLWDPELQLLWAVGDYDLVALALRGTPADPKLEVVKTASLPTAGGHDLAPVYYNSDRLWISTNTRVYQYEKSTNTWHTDFPGADYVNVSSIKGVGDGPAGRLVFTRPKSGSLHSWTTNTMNLVFPQDVRIQPDAAYYKVRVWNEAYQ